MLFNIYYINFSKVYEMKMMLSNIIKTAATIETEGSDKIDAEIEAKMGAKFLKIFNADIGSNVKSGSTDSQKVLETFKVTTTKSIILNEVIEKSKDIISFEDVNEGTLIKVDNVVLSLENEAELRTVKMFSNGSFKGMMIPGAEGLDINNVFNSIFKDYAYKIKGTLTCKDEKVIIKIPLTFENEFESLYSVDDLFIGKVSIIGIYKGKTKIDKLKNSFEFFQELGQKTTDEDVKEVHNSQYEKASLNMYKSEHESSDTSYNYLDVLAIVQNIEPNFEGDKDSKKPRKAK